MRLVDFNDRSVHYKLPETYVGESLLWVGGILGALLMVTAILRSRHPVWWLGLAASVAMGVTGLGPLLSPVFPTTTGSESFSPGLSAEEQPLMTVVPFEPVCTSGAVVAVCVHPAYAARLEETSDRFDLLLMPGCRDFPRSCSSTTIHRSAGHPNGTCFMDSVKPPLHIPPSTHCLR